MITTDTHVYFWGGACVFSNWHRTLGQIKDPLNHGLICHSSEQHFMWLKAVFFQDDRTAGLIENNPDPALAKRAGRLIDRYDDKMWSCVRLGFMTYSCYLKYSQNADLRQTLLDTGNRTLVEASPVDCVWGVGLNEDDPLILDPANWRGTNLLGQALMTVRGMI